LAAHIRLTRIGKSKRPYYRIVVLDSRDPRDGAYIECLGHYQPIEAASNTTIDLQKYDEWKSKGAKVSNIVRDIARRMRKAGV
jgi:small subunit ribosomal protein S16